MGLLTVRLVLLLLCVSIASCSLAPSRKSTEGFQDQVTQEAERKKLKHHYDLGERFYKSGDLDSAISEFQAMLQIKPEQELALYRLGTIAFKQRQFDESATYFERAIASNPKNKKAHYNLANIRLMQAENHFKYYTSLVDKDTDISRVSKLVADIDNFNTRKNNNSNQQAGSLEALAGALKR